MSEREQDLEQMSASYSVSAPKPLRKLATNWRKEEGQNHSDDIEIAHAFEAGLRVAAIELEAALDAWEEELRKMHSMRIELIEQLIGSKAR